MTVELGYLSFITRSFSVWGVSSRVSGPFGPEKFEHLMKTCKKLLDFFVEDSYVVDPPKEAKLMPRGDKILEMVEFESMRESMAPSLAGAPKQSGTSRHRQGRSRGNSGAQGEHSVSLLNHSAVNAPSHQPQLTAGTNDVAGTGIAMTNSKLSSETLEKNAMENPLLKHGVRRVSFGTPQEEQKAILEEDDDDDDDNDDDDDDDDRDFSAAMSFGALRALPNGLHQDVARSLNLHSTLMEGLSIDCKWT